MSFERLFDPNAIAIIGASSDLSRISGQHFAFVAEDEKGALVARQRALRVGEIVGNDYVVLDGIKPGERVIVSGTQFLVDGAPVSPQG